MSVLDLPDDVLGVIGEFLRDLPTSQFIRLIISSQTPLKLVRFLPDVRLPSYIYTRATLKFHLRVGPFNTLPEATTALLSLPSLRMLRSLDLSYTDVEKATVRLVGLCAPELVTLRLRRAKGAMKIFSLPKFETPKLQILDLWNAKCPKPYVASARVVLDHVRQRCGFSLRQLYLHLAEEGVSSKAQNRRITLSRNEIHLADAIESFAPHRKTLEVLCAPIKAAESHRIAELVCNMPALKRFEYPLIWTFEQELKIHYSSLENIEFAAERLRAWAQKLALPPHLTLQNMFEMQFKNSMGSETDYELEFYASLASFFCQSIWNRHTRGAEVVALFTDCLPELGVKPTPIALYEINRMTVYNRGNTDAMVMQWLQAGFDPTEPLPWHPEGASAVHLVYGAGPHMMSSAINLARKSGMVLPEWINKLNYNTLKDRAGRVPAMYYTMLTSNYDGHTSAGIDCIDNDGNTMLHYIFAAAFHTVLYDPAHFFPDIKRTLERLTSTRWPHLLKQNCYGVSVPLLIASMSRGPHASLNFFTLPESRDFFWSCSKIEEPVLNRLITFREDPSPHAMAVNPLVGLLKRYLSSGNSQDLNQKCFGNNRSLPLLHAVIESEAVWVIKVLLELPEVVGRIDINAVDSNGCTALHFAVGPRKDSVFSTPDLVQLLLTLGLSPTVADKRGWTPAMRIVNNKECLRVIGAVLTAEEKAKQSEMYLLKMKEKADNSSNNKK